MARSQKFNAASGTPPAQLQLERDAIAKDPADFDNIISFGGTQAGALCNIANRMIKTQGEFNDAINEIAATQKALIAKMETQLGDTAAAQPHSGLTEDFEAMMAALAATEAAKKEVEDMARDRIQITQDLRHYINAIPEMVDEYRNKHIPAATGEYKALLEKRAEDLSDRGIVLEGSRAASVICAQQVRMMVETMDVMIDRINPILSDMKDVYQNAKLAFEEKEAARRLSEAIEAFAQGTTMPVTVKKPLQFKPKP